MLAAEDNRERKQCLQAQKKKSIGGQCSVIKKRDEGDLAVHNQTATVCNLSHHSLSPSMNEPFPFLAR